MGNFFFSERIFIFHLNEQVSCEIKGEKFYGSEEGNVDISFRKMFQVEAFSSSGICWLVRLVSKWKIVITVYYRGGDRFVRLDIIIQ